VEALERLMALAERHDANQAKKAFIEAMGRFQSMKPELVRAQAVSYKEKHMYNFCPLPDIEKALRVPLSECGLSYRFENLNREGSFGIRCVVTHIAGHSESTEMYAPADASGNKNQIQAIGSTSTYLMRYTIVVAFALTTADEDDDGQSHSDLPLTKLMQHNEVVRQYFDGIGGIKAALAEKDYYQAAVIFDTIPAEARNLLWVAPTRGGIFTTEERAKIKSNEFHHAHLDYIAEKQSKAEV